jgi:hypothetical protein
MAEAHVLCARVHIWYGFELVIKGLVVPPTLQAAADEVIKVTGAFAAVQVSANGMARPRSARNLLDCGWGGVKQSSTNGGTFKNDKRLCCQLGTGTLDGWTVRKRMMVMRYVLTPTWIRSRKKFSARRTKEHNRNNQSRPP